MSLSSFLFIPALALLTLCVACQPVSGAIELSTPSPEQQLMDEYRKTLTSLEIQAGFHCMGPIGKDVYDLFEEVVRKQHALDAYTALNGPPDARDREYLENGNYEDAAWFSENEELQDALAIKVYYRRIYPVGEGGKHLIELDFHTDRKVREMEVLILSPSQLALMNGPKQTYVPTPTPRIKITCESSKTALCTVDHKTCEPTLLSISD